MAATRTSAAARRTAALSLAADLGCVLVFAASGRRSHAESLTAAGVAGTAWPFLVGTAVGWLLSRGWRRPTAVAPTGVTVWACTLAVGMMLRRATAQGTAVSFVVVAALVTGALLLGWRAAARAVAGRARAQDS